MTHDEIIEMAREAGFKMENSAAIQAAEIFANLVAAKKQELVADSAFLERVLAAMEGVIDVAGRKTNEFDALRGCIVDLTLMLHLPRPAPVQQEPVADDFFRMIADRNPKPFSSLQRTWAGLTDEQIDACWNKDLWKEKQPHHIFAKAIEAKLKEINT